MHAVFVQGSEQRMQKSRNGSKLNLILDSDLTASYVGVVVLIISVNDSLKVFRILLLAEIR